MEAVVQGTQVLSIPVRLFLGRGYSWVEAEVETEAQGCSACHSEDLSLVTAGKMSPSLKKVTDSTQYRSLPAAL